MKIKFRNVKISAREINGILFTLKDDPNFSTMCHKAKMNHLDYMNSHREAIIAYEDRQLISEK